MYIKEVANSYSAFCRPPPPTRMRKAAALSATAQQSLVRSQLELEDNLEVKANSLYVDEVLCGQYREPTVVHHF